jgi:hypothetical protein
LTSLASPEATLTAFVSPVDEAAAVGVVADEKRERCDLRWMEKSTWVVRPPLLLLLMPPLLLSISSFPLSVASADRAAAMKGAQYIR